MTDHAASTDVAVHPDESRVNRAFTTSMLVSGIRCTLTYVLLPFVAPLVGLSGSVGPVLGLVIGVVAIVANVVSIRRFHRSGHRWKVPATWAHAGVILLVTVLVAGDIAALLG
jgi:hypothetical protein